MSRKRLTTAFVIVLIGLSSVLLLPKSFGLKPAAVHDAFPSGVGEWHGQYVKAGEKEQKVLDEATTFRKRLFRRESPNHLLQVDSINATMVLSGDDMNNSIHRPERCLLAQGYKSIEAKVVEIDCGGKKFKVKRLTFIMELPDGKKLSAMMYYWFVGSDHITSSHYGRTIYDIKHRLLQGTNQRWAYVSLQTQFGPEWNDAGNTQHAPNTEEEADALMQDFIQRTFFQIHKTEEIKGWEEAGKTAEG